MTQWKGGNVLENETALSSDQDLVNIVLSSECNFLHITHLAPHMVEAASLNPGLVGCH